MKYNININQKVLEKSTLNLIDCAILDWVITICSSKNDSIEEKRIEGMTWIDYNTIISDMPLLRIKSKSALTPRFKRIENEGYIKTKMVGTGSAQKMFVSLTEKIDSLFIETNGPFIKMNGAVHENEQGAVHECEHIIILDTNHYTNDKDMCNDGKKEDSFNQFWLEYPKKENKIKAREKWFKKGFEKDIDKILGFIKEAKKTDRWKKGFIKDPVTFLNKQSWYDDLTEYYDRSSSPAGVHKDRNENDYMKNVIKLKN